VEYATRGGSLRSGYYGETEELLPKHAWHIENSQHKTRPVGSPKLNDLAFFGVQGNVFMCCQESLKQHP
jgi:hypothetical protein